MNNATTLQPAVSTFFEGIQHVINPEASEEHDKSIYVLPVGMKGYSFKSSKKRWNKANAGEDILIESAMAKHFEKDPDFNSITESPADMIFDSEGMF